MKSSTRSALKWMDKKIIATNEKVLHWGKTHGKAGVEKVAEMYEEFDRKFDRMINGKHDGNLSKKEIEAKKEREAKDDEGESGTKVDEETETAVAPPPAPKKKKTWMTRMKSSTRSALKWMDKKIIATNEKVLHWGKTHGKAGVEKVAEMYEEFDRKFDRMINGKHDGNLSKKEIEAKKEREAKDDEGESGTKVDEETDAGEEEAEPETDSPSKSKSKPEERLLTFRL
jgi:hypothetical protein